MTPRSLLRRAAEAFREYGVPDPETDASWILAALCSRSPLALRLDDTTELDDRILDQFHELSGRRIRREPLQYILGETPFCGFSFRTDPRALIPRPETELLCEWAAELLTGKPGASVLDLCCGSGCIGISLKLLRPDLSVTLSDISEDALSLARENAGRLNASVRFALGDMFSPFSDLRFDLIVSNPPYIPSAQYDGLQRELMWEPKEALLGGNDGLDFYRVLARKAPEYLSPGGMLLMELGDREADPVRRLMEESGFSGMEVRRDLHGLERMILGYYS